MALKMQVNNCDLAQLEHTVAVTITETLTNNLLINLKQW